MDSHHKWLRSFNPQLNHFVFIILALFPIFPVSLLEYHWCHPQSCFFFFSSQVIPRFCAKIFFPALCCQMLTSGALKMFSQFIWAILNIPFKKFFPGTDSCQMLTFDTLEMFPTSNTVLCTLSPICTWWFNLLLLIMLVVQFLNLAILFSVLYCACFILLD
jgi:hypothetical protein